MAYTITFSNAITVTRDVATITDTTTFGGSNPARNTVLVFLSGNKMNFDNTIAEALVLTPDSTDALVVSSWSYPYPTDGWFQFFYVIIKDLYSGGTTYAKYDAVYDDATQIVYRSLVNTNLGNTLSDTSAWEVIPSPSLLAQNKGEANESLNIESTIYQRVFSYNSQFLYGSFAATASEACCGDCGDLEADAKYDLFSLWLNGIIIDDQRSLLPQGEKIARRIEATFGSC